MKKQVVYEGDVNITKDNWQEWQSKLKNTEKISGYLSINAQAKLEASNLKSVGGNLYINAQAKLDNLKSVGGNLYINNKIDTKLEKRLWKNNRNNQWYMNDLCSEWLLSQQGKIKYKISDVEFEKELFDNVRKDKLTAQEVFAIHNIEQRRIAYERIDKLKMKELPNLKIINQLIDKYNNLMKIISFTLEGYEKPFRFLNCVCPSTQREYFVETKQDNCKSAVAKSFGMDEIEFNEEW